MNSNQVTTDERDVRLKGTIWVWSLSIPLFLLCIPIIALTDTGVLVPLFVLGSAATATASIWFFYEKSAGSISSEVKALQDRIANLETIAGHDEFDSRFKALERNQHKSEQLHHKGYSASE